MGLNMFFKSVEKNYAIGIYGLLISLISIASGYYLAIKDKEPKLTFDILSNTEVFSINEDISKLKVIYNNEDLRSKKQKLFLLTIRVANLGDDDIKETDYYSNSEFGFNLKNAIIAERPILLDGSNEFLRQNVRIKNDSINKVFFNKIPLDKDQSFTIKLLTIVNDKSVPTILPFGYISGTKGNIQVFESYKSNIKEEAPITEWDKALRILGILFIIFILIIILLIALNSRPAPDTSKISSAQRESVALNIKENLLESKDKYQIEVFNILVDIYSEFGFQYLMEVRNNYIENSVFMEKFILESEKGNDLNILFDLEEEKKEKLKKLISLISQNGLVNNSVNGIEINMEFLKRLNGLNWTISEFQINVCR